MSFDSLTGSDLLRWARFSRDLTLVDHVDPMRLTQDVIGVVVRDDHGDAFGGQPLDNVKDL